MLGSGDLARRQEILDVTPAPIAREIGIVRRRDEANRSCSATEHVACAIDETLQSVRGEVVVIVHDVVVRRARGALESAVRLQEEVVVVDGGDAPVDDGPWTRVAFAVCASFVDGIEAGVVSFSSDALIG